MIAVPQTDLIPTVELLVSWPVEPERPGYAPTAWTEPEAVAGCLFARAETDDIDRAHRPEGVSERVRLDFPKGFGRSLRGCRVACQELAPGRWYEVEGDPVPYIADATPGPWNLTAWAVRADG